MSFDNLGLSDALLTAIREKGYTTPSPIQAQAIPAILSGRDVIAASQTGTGKTAGFTLPLLQLLADQGAGGKRQGSDKRPLRALIMTPTRELAAQVGESVKTYGKHLSLRSAEVFGGVNINPQISALRRGLDILVATPGRLLDLHSQHAVSLANIEVLILDEADRMLDMGFIHDIRRIIKLMPPKRQNLMFSATFSNEIRTLTDQLLHNPISVEVAARNTAAELVEQQVYRAEKSDKPALLRHLIQKGKWEQVLVFTRTKHGADRLCKRLSRYNITSSAIHGNKSQNARTRALSEFKAGRIRVLVATDIAARGLDIKELPHVVNYELPNVSEDYVHRIGRTARAGASGHAVSLVSEEEVKLLRKIEKLLDQRIPVGKASGYQDAEPAGGRQTDPRNHRVDNRRGSAASKEREKKREKGSTEPIAGKRRPKPKRKPNGGSAGGPKKSPWGR